MRRLTKITGVGLIATATLAGTMCAGQECRTGEQHLSGRVLDSTEAVIEGASIVVDGGETLLSDAQGQFRTVCVARGEHQLRISADGFSPVELKTAAGSAAVHMRLLTVETTTDAVDGGGVSSDDIAGSKTLHEAELKQLADDPDELARQLQVLAATAGGTPGQAIIAVDGFQNGGRIPPKSAIAFIRINPDLFSAEYERPPYRGGRVEIFTKPGQSALHGTVFTTQSAGFLNAADPFAPSRAAIGKQRYGFDLSGPLQKNKSDFAIALEHRQIDQFAVVNAATLDSAGESTTTRENVATPQTLWEGSARFGMTVNAKDTLVLAYTAGVNSLGNIGVGGIVLEEAGYNSAQSEHVVRLTNLQTLSASTVHETRVGYTWRYSDDTPNSTAPSLQVAGAFTGGGATTQGLHSHERDLEVDDDVMTTRGKHTLKVGVEVLDAALRDTLPNDFNGSYVFGGGVAPTLDGTGTSTITGLEQYRRALLGLPGGTPTFYSVTAGDEAIALNQLRVVLYGQDQWKPAPRLQLSLGVRWAMQSAPVTVSNLGPRVGVAWSPDRKQTWIFHLRSGLFFSPVDSGTALEARRLNGTNQRESLIYSPTYGQPLGTGSATITTLRAPLGQLTQTPSLQSHFGVEHEFPRHWHAQANLYVAQAWDILRSRNVNAPLDDSPTGARPLAANEDIDQYQQTGHLHGDVLFLGIDQHSLRRLQVFAGYIRMDLRTNADSDSAFPQSSLSDKGEMARPSYQATHHFIVFSTLTLPRKVSFSTQFDAASGLPYNVTTGFDNNGDGVVNDRPYLATANDTTVYATRFGPLASTGDGATIGRNAGTLPWNVHLDMNMSRSFNLTHPASGDAKSLAVNVRSTNVLNHNNATAVGGVLGSPLFGVPYAADPGRRIEAGLRYSF